MLYIAVFITFLATFILIYEILSVLYRNRICIENRIDQIKELDSGRQIHAENKSFSERTLKPFYTTISQLLLKVTPRHKVAMLNKKLERAGVLKNSTTEKWLFVKLMLIVIVSIISGLLAHSIEPNGLKDLLIAIFIMLFVNTIFNFCLSRKIEKRKKKILKELPYTLDLITVSIEAGLSFDGAMARVVNTINGELCYEFAKSLKEIKMGIQRKLALKNMSERCEVKELSTFITALIQADEFGVSLGRVLRIEASNLREYRKQTAREKAMKAPIKMLFPLIFFIFPSIFIIILGPAIIRILKIFVAR